MQLKKDARKNKQLVSYLRQKVFLGYRKLKNSIKNKNAKNYLLYDKKREYLPFEYEYQIMYKDKYLNKLNKPTLNDLTIIKTSNKIRPEKELSNKLLITENSNIKTIRNKHNKTESDLISNKMTLKKIFRNENEKKIFSELPFFSLYKNNKNKGLKTTQEDFLYKISHNHNRTHTEYNNNKNISLYRSINLKNRNRYKNKTQDLLNSNEKPQLQLTIKNITPNHFKMPILSTKERHMKIIFNKISLLKSIPNNIIKNINDMINSVESEDYEDKETIISNKDKDKINPSLSSLDRENNNNRFYIKKININNKLNNERAKTKTYYNSNFNRIINKKMKYYSPHFYSIQQLNIKNKRYEKTHNEAFENFQEKINIHEDYKKLLNNYNYNDEEIYRPLTLGIIEPSKNLTKIKKMNHKLNYLHESRIRDIIIARKLKHEFDPDDINRILNGKKPLKYDKNDKNKKNEVSEFSENNKKENE